MTLCVEHCGRVALDEEVCYLVWYLCPFYLDLRLTIGQPLHCNGLEERSPISNVKVAFSWGHPVVIWDFKTAMFFVRFSYYILKHGNSSCTLLTFCMTLDGAHNIDFMMAEIQTY